MKDIYQAINTRPLDYNPDPEFYPISNYGSFPEEKTGWVEGVVYGLHCSFSDLDGGNLSMGAQSCFYGEEKLRAMGFFSDPWSVVDRIKGSHGDHVYVCRIYGDNECPIAEIEHGSEYRQIAGLVDFKRLSL